MVANAALCYRPATRMTGEGDRRSPIILAVNRVLGAVSMSAWLAIQKFDAVITHLPSRLLMMNWPVMDF